MKTFTFICLGAKQVPGAIDVQALDADAYRRHALQLMHDHTSALAIEVWCDEVVIDTIVRDGDWPKPTALTIGGQ